MLQWHNGNDTNTNIDIFRHVSCDRAFCLQKIHVTIGNVNVQCNLRGFAICMQILIGFILCTGCLKKMSFSGKTALTAFKLIQNAKGLGVLENSGYHYFS